MALTSLSSARPERRSAGLLLCGKTEACASAQHSRLSKWASLTKRRGCCFSQRPELCPVVVACQKLSFPSLQASGTQKSKPTMATKTMWLESPAQQMQNLGPRHCKYSPRRAIHGLKHGHGATGTGIREGVYKCPQEKRGQKERKKALY